MVGAGLGVQGQEPVLTYNHSAHSCSPHLPWWWEQWLIGVCHRGQEGGGEACAFLPSPDDHPSPCLRLLSHAIGTGCPSRLTAQRHTEWRAGWSVGVAQPLHLRLPSGFRSAAQLPWEPPVYLSSGAAGREAPRCPWHWALDSQVSA